jgi:hypothetical protein
MMLAVAHRKPKRGKFETFDDDENAALREELQAYVAKNGLSTNDLKPILLVSQQTAAGYLNGSGGFSRLAARQLCWMLGYEGVDDFLRAKGVFKVGPNRVAGTGPTTPQEFAMTLARRVGVTDLAMDRVNKRYEREPHHIERWWLDHYIQEQSAVDTERLRRLDEARRPRRDDDA